MVFRKCSFLVMIPKFFRAIGGNYLVSEFGKVWSNHTNKFLSPHLNKGYSVHNLRVNGERVKKFTHHLVAETWVAPRPSDEYHTDHIDNDKLNNHYSNLRWVTQTTNNQKRSNTILTKEKVKEARELYARGCYSHGDLAKKYGIEKSAMTRALKGNTWRDE